MDSKCLQIDRLMPEESSGPAFKGNNEENQGVRGNRPGDKNAPAANEDQDRHVTRAYRFIRAMETNWKDLSKITFHGTVDQVDQPPMRNASGPGIVTLDSAAAFLLRLNRSN